MRPKSPHRVSYVSLVTTACIIACSAVCARAGNIFDDDWTPPKSTVQPHAAPAQPSLTAPVPAPPAPVRPTADPAAAPPAVAPPTPDAPPQPHLRHPIPGKLEQARSRGLLKEAFAGQLKDRSNAGRRKLALALLDEVPKSADNISDEYVLLGGAIEASKDAGALALCSQAADVMASQYEVDGLSIKTDAALKMDLRGAAPAAAAENVQAALELVDSLLAVEDFSTAAKILATARRAAASDAALASVVQKRMQAVESLRAAHDRLEVSLEKLKTSPDDPAANLAVGSYLCFNRGDWEKGLGLLARGSDTNLKQVATLELSHPKTADEVIRLADRWWEVGAKQPEMIRVSIHQHAASFYKVALESVTGLQRKLLERRIAEASADQMASRQSVNPEKVGQGLIRKRIVNLLSLIDVQRDSVHGTWKAGADGLTSSADSEARIRMAYQPPEEYDFHIRFSRKTGKDQIVQILWHAGHSFDWEIGFRNSICGIELLKNLSIIEPSNPTFLNIPNIITNGRQYDSVVKVRKGSVATYLDGKLLCEYKTDYSDLAGHPRWPLGIEGLGIGSYRSVTTFDVVEVKEISGEGRSLRDVTKGSEPTK